MNAGTISNVTLRVPDLEAADAFFDPFLSFLGYHRAIDAPGMVIWEDGESGCTIGLWPAEDDTGKSPARGIDHVAFSAGSRARVDECYELLRRLPARILHPPTHFDAPRCYAVFFQSPDGTLIEVSHHTLTLNDMQRSGGRIARR